MTADILLTALRSPESMTALSSVAWTELMQRGRRRALLGKLGTLAADAGVLGDLPPAVQRQFGSMMRLADHNANHLKAEAFQILHALREIECPVVFLKGAAYALLDLMVDRGRVSSDIDILVPRDRIDAVEQTLQHVGWQPLALTDYDRQYYRRWMHEIPPLRHRIRATVIDVHHTLLPLTGRITPDPKAVLQDAVSVEVHGRPALVPRAEDLVVHAAAHLFQDGDLAERLRDLLDIHQLVTELSTTQGFWDRLAARANLHQCGRPVGYALHFTQRMLGTAVRGDVMQALENKPAGLTARTLDTLVPVAIVPSLPDRAPVSARVARWLLFVRSHWLRMPPVLLARHLAIKAWQSLTRRFRR